MAKLTTKFTLPIVLAGLFVIVMFAALNFNYSRPGAEILVISSLAIFVFFFGLAAGQSLSSPVKKILNNATELSKGNLSSRVYLDTKDELADLANTLNKIAEELQTSYDQEANAQKSIDIKVRIKTQELEETIYALEQKVKNRTVELERLVTESGRLQQDVKGKEEEILNLKNELGEFKQKIEKYSKAKKAVKTKQEPVKEDLEEVVPPAPTEEAKEENNITE